MSVDSVLHSEAKTRNIQFTIFLKDLFGVDHFFKSLYWMCSNIASVLCFGFFGLGACGILPPWPGIEPAPPALEGKVLTTGPPGKSPIYRF